MIEGITHDKGELHKVTKFRGKISTGFAPGEGPNKGKFPMQAGFYRMLKEVVKTERIGASQTPITRKEWILNTVIQKKLEDLQPASSKMTPRRIEIISLYKTVEDMWESSLSLYSSSDGLVCRSHGNGTTAKYLQYDEEGNRIWVNRVIDGIEACNYHKCPDYQKKQCKAMGMMKCFPAIDLAPNPYRFETRSVNTIVGIESALDDLRMLLSAAHIVKESEAGCKLPFDGFFGAKLYLTLRKVKSGGRDVFITDLMPTQEFTDIVMEPIKRGLATKSKQAMLAGSKKGLSLLESAGQRLIEGAENAESTTMMDLDDEKAVAVQFGADAASEEPTDSSPVDPSTNEEASEVESSPEEDAAVALLNEDGKSPDKK